MTGGGQAGAAVAFLVSFVPEGRALLSWSLIQVHYPTARRLGWGGLRTEGGVWDGVAATKEFLGGCAVRMPISVTMKSLETEEITA